MCKSEDTHPTYRSSRLLELLLANFLLLPIIQIHQGTMDWARPHGFKSTHSQAAHPGQLFPLLKLQLLVGTQHPFHALCLAPASLTSGRVLPPRHLSVLQHPTPNPPPGRGNGGPISSPRTAAVTHHFLFGWPLAPQCLELDYTSSHTDSNCHLCLTLLLIHSTNSYWVSSMY